MLYSHTIKLVRFYEGMDGLKTGFTDDAGYCVTATAKRNDLRLISVVMGETTSDTRNSETSKMLDYGFNKYVVEKIISKDKKVGTIELNKGEKRHVDVVTKQDVVVLNEVGKGKRKTDVNLNIEKNKVPIKKGQKIGTLQVIENNKIIQEVDVTVEEDINKVNIIKLYLRHLEDILSGYINI